MENSESEASRSIAVFNAFIGYPTLPIYLQSLSFISETQTSLNFQSHISYLFLTYDQFCVWIKIRSWSFCLIFSRGFDQRHWSDRLPSSSPWWVERWMGEGIPLRLQRRRSVRHPFALQLWQRRRPHQTRDGIAEKAAVFTGRGALGNCQKQLHESHDQSSVHARRTGNINHHWW